MNQLLKEPYVNNNYVMYCSLSALFDSIWHLIQHIHVHTNAQLHRHHHHKTLFVYSCQFHVLNERKLTWILKRKCNFLQLRYVKPNVWSFAVCLLFSTRTFHTTQLVIFVSTFFFLFSFFLPTYQRPISCVFVCKSAVILHNFFSLVLCIQNTFCVCKAFTWGSIFHVMFMSMHYKIDTEKNLGFNSCLGD